MKHIMIDLETMGTRPGSAIASIGACAFDPETGVMGHLFYRRIDLDSCARSGLAFDADTIVWWLKQSDAARGELAKEGGFHIAKALQDFRSFWLEEDGKYLWGHGANFDEPLLAAAYRALHVEQPWLFWNARCTRTIYGLAGVKPNRAAGVHHNAMDDARAQAEAVIDAYAKLKLPPER